MLRLIITLGVLFASVCSSSTAKVQISIARNSVIGNILTNVDNLNASASATLKILTSQCESEAEWILYQGRYIMQMFDDLKAKFNENQNLTIDAKCFGGINLLRAETIGMYQNMNDCLRSYYSMSSGILKPIIEQDITKLKKEIGNSIGRIMVYKSSTRGLVSIKPMTATKVISLLQQAINSIPPNIDGCTTHRARIFVGIQQLLSEHEKLIKKCIEKI